MILLDTSFLVALFHSQDSQHRRAKEIQARLKNQKLLLTEYVLLELSTILALRGSVHEAHQAVQSLLEAEETSFFPCSVLFPATMSKMFSQKKYALSFVDTSLIVLLETGEAEKIVTFDVAVQKAAGQTRVF